MALFSSSPWPHSLPRDPAQLAFDNDLPYLVSAARSQAWRGRPDQFYESMSAIVLFAFHNGHNTLPCRAHLIMSDERLMDWWERGIRVRLRGYLQPVKQAGTEAGGP